MNFLSIDAPDSEIPLETLEQPDSKEQDSLSTQNNEPVEPENVDQDDSKTDSEADAPKSSYGLDDPTLPSPPISDPENDIHIFVLEGLGIFAKHEINCDCLSCYEGTSMTIVCNDGECAVRNENDKFLYAEIDSDVSADGNIKKIKLTGV